ncbi:hypothetical protein [Sphingomonas azotifigens]|uniref:hypothetical protein n=1 Tax=Sphingomonas azotifigens TaxID=330920 RepID=UPI000A05D83A|nr:hypothetical protein [Sphingomonas azotifigens]
MHLPLFLLLGAAPAGPVCDLGPDAVVVHRLADLPGAVATEVRRGFAAGGIAEAGAPYSATDVMRAGLPQRQFLRAYGAGRYWILWFEQGGFASGQRTVALRRVDPRAGGAARYQMEPGTVFAGNLCDASKAILAGVRSATAGP